MKSRTIEIIDNHIKTLEEELEWYQEKNREWQEKCEKLEKPELFDKYPAQFMFLGEPIDYWITLQHYAEINSVDKLVVEVQKLRQENARLREQLRWHDVSELPDIDNTCISKWSKTVVFQVDRMVDQELAFYDYHICYWRNLRTMEKIKTFPHSRWCYIPDDNQGTDCTPEGR